jgi:cullin 3
MQKNTDAQWSILSKGLEEIYKHNESQLSFEELYRYLELMRNAYLMVIAKDGDRLYKSLKGFITQQLEELVRLRIRIPPSRPSVNDCEVYLRAVVDVWEEHTTALGMIRDVMMYLDRTYLPPRHLPLTYDVGLELFRIAVLGSSSVKDYLTQSIVSLVTFERDSELVDRSLLKSAIDMLSSLSSGSAVSRSETCYDSLLQPALLEATRLYYQQKSLELISNNDAPQYLILVQHKLEEEQQRSPPLLEKTMSQLIPVVQEELISKHIETIIEMKGGFIEMINEKEFDQLTTIFTVLGMVSEGHHNLSTKLGQYVKQLGKYHNECGLGVQEWMNAILQLKQQFDKVLNFLPDPAFEAQVNVALQDIVSTYPKSAQVISSYADKGIKSCLKGEQLPVVENVMTVFRYLNEKDIFERFYKHMLAKRLLSKNVHEDLEKEMLSALKAECGYQFTAKLEGMFQDMKLSAEISNEFRAKCPSMSVHVLTSTYWPFNDKSAEVPEEVQSLTRQFENFYSARHNGRVLTWMKHLGSVDIRVRFESGTKDINMPTMCMIVLLHCFQTDEPIGYSTIRSRTGMTDPDLKRVLITLTLGKFRLLSKTRAGKDIGEEDVFQFNAKFSNPLNRFKIQAVVMQEDEAEDQQVEDKVKEDRKYLIEAMIIRVMKARQSLDHNSLISEILQQSKIRPDIGLIKSRIESLIERDYLVRDEGNKGVYIYQA